ncbi:neural cell adhesion molecule L1.2 isoform X2 [Kryptolebias marmoratus]|uniref:neural cell adhesion molecule L1.2 isoform X2 n=1 Tax=Kryptolebias marmoratus TaxID=37003 RepID=UPI0007F88336|nr:neural cell adhesion molecule L1.2 isoform X2 [Kryptolebias marmoratus]
MPHTQQQQVCSRGQRSPHLLPLVLTLLSLPAQPSRAAIQIPSNYHIGDHKKPPEITKQPQSVTVFSPEDFSLSCEASGIPPPIFRWTKDGEEFDPGTDPELEITETLGSFEFSMPSDSTDTLKQYQGKYVCYASNELGTAVSNEAILRTDVPPSQQKEKRVTLKAEEGNGYVLKCNPPQSSMEPIIHWMDLRLRHIQLSKRVVVGKDGNLYFAHLTVDDSRDDYTCNLQYLETRTILAKEPITLRVTSSNSVLRNRRPHMMRPTGSNSTYHALRDQTLELECIVQGLPAPEITWVKRNGELLEARAKKEMFGRRLHLSNITESDSGEYQCIAQNTQGTAVHTYSLTVEAAPYWKKVPESQIYAPGETVKLDCEAKGTPSPTLSWTINGTPLSATDRDPRRTVTANSSLILRDVIFGDTAIYQCQASNKHGTILTNAYVYVIELPPQILTEDRRLYSVTEGQKVLLDCETFGSPKPKVIWDAEASSVLADPRVNPLTNGGLQIFNVTHDDKGLYTCSVQNSNLSISAELEVFNRTVILSPPKDLKVQPGHTAVFTCVAHYDASLKVPIIQWRKNNTKLFESSSNEKYTFDGPEFRISNVEPDDEGLYTCEIITSLDKADASAMLILYDRPDPPDLLQISDPKHRAVTLSWTPGYDHNSPVLEYVVEFEDQGLKARGWEVLQRVGGNQTRTVLPLWPYLSYRFRVIAINEVGKSDPSKPSEMHNTRAEAPDNNPEDVRSDSVDPDTLVITWEKMDYRNFNGPDFKYTVQWRRVVGSGPKWHESNTTAPPFTVNGVGNFSAFEIKVQAVNTIGVGPEPDPVIGYSGEDVPLEAPMDVGVQMINSTTIKVRWFAVDRESVRGHLLGYKIYVTRKGSKGHHRGRRSRESESTMVEETGPSEEQKTISNLRPFSHYVLAVTVVNKKGEGPPSEPLAFETPEGVPGPPTSLILDSPSETEMTLHWTPPAHPNGILTGYILQYQRITENDDSPMQVEKIEDPTATHFTLKGLDLHSHYRFYLRGSTAPGDGEASMVIGATTLEGAPPDDLNVSVGETLVNVSWVAKKRHRNVDFYISYLKKNDGSKWKKSEKVNSSQSFYQLQGLSPGSHYRLRFIYGNSTFRSIDINTAGSVMAVQQSIATQGWFIGVVSAIALLLLILLILCFIRRSKGGKYSVKDKEDGPMDSEVRPMKDETFGEYRSLESDLEEKRTASQPSLCEESKLCSEDTLNFNGSSAITTELNMDESLASQISRPSVGFHGMPDNTTVSSATNGVPNSVNILN